LSPIAHFKKVFLHLILDCFEPFFLLEAYKKKMKSNDLEKVKEKKEVLGQI